MFESQTEVQEAPPNRVRAIAIIGGIGLVVLIVLVWLITQAMRPPHVSTEGLEGALRAGDAEFDSYREMMVMEDKEIIVYPNLLGMLQFGVRAKLTNQGDRTVSGMEMRGRILDLGDKVLAENISQPIPRLRSEPLAPGQSMRISVKIDAPSKVTEDDVKDVTLELYGLRFQ